MEYFSQKDIGGILKPNNCSKQNLGLLGGHYKILILKKMNSTDTRSQEIYLLGQNDLTVIPWNFGKNHLFIHGLVILGATRP